jgi:hypothetical protein
MPKINPQIEQMTQILFIFFLVPSLRSLRNLRIFFRAYARASAATFSTVKASITSPTFTSL